MPYHFRNILEFRFKDRIVLESDTHHLYINMPFKIIHTLFITDYFQLYAISKQTKQRRVDDGLYSQVQIKSESAYLLSYCRKCPNK